MTTSILAVALMALVAGNTEDVVPDDTTHDDAALVSKLTAQIEPLTPGLQVTIVVDHNYCE